MNLAVVIPVEGLEVIAPIAVPRSQVYARVLYDELFASAHQLPYGPGFLINAPVLDSILDRADSVDENQPVRS